MPQDDLLSQQPTTPKTVTSVKTVQMAVVHYLDGAGVEHTQLAVVGDNTVLLASGKEFGFSGSKAEPAGIASGWLRDGILKAMHGGENTGELQKPKASSPSDEE